MYTSCSMWSFFCAAPFTSFAHILWWPNLVSDSPWLSLVNCIFACFLSSLTGSTGSVEEDFWDESFRFLQCLRNYDQSSFFVVLFSFSKNVWFMWMVESVNIIQDFFAGRDTFYKEAHLSCCFTHLSL